MYVDVVVVKDRDVAVVRAGGRGRGDALEEEVVVVFDIDNIEITHDSMIDIVSAIDVQSVNEKDLF